MANSKSEQHIINLANPDLNRERLKGEIKPWDGFNDRNSPYLSGECLPLYTKSINNLRSNAWIAPDLRVFDMRNFRLCEDGTAVGPQLNKVKWTQIGNTTHPYIFGGTDECYAAGIYDTDAVNIYWRNNLKYQFVYGTGFNWDVALAWFGINAKVIDNVAWVAYCWQGKCSVTRISDYQTFNYTSSDTLGLSSEDYLLTNLHTAIYFGSSKVYFLNDTPNKILVFDTSNRTWTTLTSMSYSVSYTKSNSYNDSPTSGTFSGTANVSDILMDQNGYFIINSQMTKDDYYCVARNFRVNESTNTLESTNDVLWDVSPNKINDPPSWAATVERVNDNLVSSRYLKCVRLYKVSHNDSYGFPISQDYSFTNCTALDYTTGDALQDGRIERGMHVNIGDFRILYTQGNLSTISVKENDDYRGSIIEPWGTVLDVVYINGKLGYKSSKDEQWYSLSVVSTDTDQPVFVVYKDRYIIIQTDKFYNTYDIVARKWLHFADDWNNRWKGTYGSYAYPYMIASGTESEYQISEYPFPGAQFSSIWSKQPLGGFLSTNQTPVPAAPYAPRLAAFNYVPCYLNLFASQRPVTKEYYNINEEHLITEAEKTPHYITSVLDTFFVLGYQGIYWAYDENPLLNPPLTSRYQTDLYTLIDLGTTQAIALQQFGKEYLVYYAASESLGFTHLCCVQSMFYGLSEDGIYSVDYSEGVLSNSKKIANITGLQYIAYTPICIYFWNHRNRTMYMFTGDAILKPIQGESSFTSITQSKFRPDTEETFMLTNNGLYVSANDYCYKIYEGIYTDVFFTNSGFALKESNKCTCYSYYKPSSDFYVRPLILETMLYGAGNNIVSTTDCIYMRFYRGDIGNATATVYVSGHILTDVGANLQENTSKTYTITKDDWETTTNTYYLRFQPKYQKGIGMSIRVESEVPLIYLGFGSKVESLQITQK